MPHSHILHYGKDLCVHDFVYHRLFAALFRNFTLTCLYPSSCLWHVIAGGVTKQFHRVAINALYINKWVYILIYIQYTHIYIYVLILGNIHVYYVYIHVHNFINGISMAYDEHYCSFMAFAVNSSTSATLSASFIQLNLTQLDTVVKATTTKTENEL